MCLIEYSFNNSENIDLDFALLGSVFDDLEDRAEPIYQIGDCKKKDYSKFSLDDNNNKFNNEIIPLIKKETQKVDTYLVVVNINSVFGIDKDKVLNLLNQYHVTLLEALSKI